MKKKREKRLKLPLRRIVSDNVFVLSLVRKAAPGLIFLRLSLIAVSAVTNFLSGAYLLRFAINGIEDGKSFREMVTFAVAMLIANVIVEVIFQTANNSIIPKKMNKATRYVHEQVYKKASSVELERYENPLYYNTLQKAVDECQTRVNAVLDTVCMTAWRVITFSANLGLLVAIDPWLLVFVIAPLLLTPLTARSNELGYKRTMDTKEVNRRRDYSRRAFYLADYAKELRLTRMPELLLKRYREAGDENVKILGRYGWKITGLNYISSEVRELFSCCVAFIYALYKTIVKKTMKYGDCIVVIDSIGQVAYTLADSANMLLRFQENALYIENLREFLDYENKITDGDKALPESGDLVLENVSFRYEGASDYTLKNINMRIGANEKIAIVGHNGAGKTTLTKLLLRFYDCEGSITYGGENIKDFKIAEYRDAFASVMQDYHIFALTVKENVVLRPLEDGDDESIKAALIKSGIDKKVATFPQEENTVLTREFDDDGVLLSGGEQQKIAISHVYSKQNRFVILDEPSSALDPIAEHEMYKRMDEACEGCGMIFISHRLSSAVMADRIYLIENGEVCEVGTHKELMEKNGRYAEMFHRQAENYAEVEENA
ncbi:MAG: ABC transporter ATP-binding protein [Clostridia bacterium]|nr:ABC transporter ATP-binding protein [Clostridia bacterium]